MIKSKLKKIINFIFMFLILFQIDLFSKQNKNTKKNLKKKENSEDALYEKKLSKILIEPTKKNNQIINEVKNDIKSDFKINYVPKFDFDSILLIDLSSGSTLLSKNDNEIFSVNDDFLNIILFMFFSSITASSYKKDYEINFNSFDDSSKNLKKFTLSELLKKILEKNNSKVINFLKEILFNNNENFLNGISSYLKSINITSFKIKNINKKFEIEFSNTDAAKILKIFINENHDLVEKFFGKNIIDKNFVKINEADFYLQNSNSNKHSIIISAAKENQRLLLILNGLKNKKNCYNESLNIIGWAFSNFSNKVIFKKNELIQKISVWYGDSDIVPAVSYENIVITLQNFVSIYPKVVINYETPISAPIKKGMKIGEIKISSPNYINEINFPIFSAIIVEEAGFFKKLVDSIVYLIFGIKTKNLKK